MTVGFVVKAALLLTDKRTWKVIGAIVAGVVLLIALPVVILTGVFERLGQVDFTDSSLKQQVLEGLTSEDRAGLEAWQSTSTTLEAAMEERVMGTGRPKPWPYTRAGCIRWPGRRDSRRDWWDVLRRGKASMICWRM